MGNDSDTPIRVHIPTRIDFAGGWSDVAHFSAREGGAVLNAAIDRYVEGSARWDEQELRLQYTLALPPSSHLGSSGAIDVAWLALTYGLMGRRQAPEQLAETAYRLEKLLGIAGGRQDQYAAALGGFNLLRFGAEDEPAQVDRLALPVDTVSALEERCVLCCTGSPPASGSAHERVWERYLRGDAQVADALRAIRDSVLPACDALLGGDFSELAGLLTANREAVRLLHPDTITARMDALFAAGEVAGALGSKACGAGGGGTLLFLCAEGRRRDVEDALRARGGTLIAFAFAQHSIWT